MVSDDEYLYFVNRALDGMAAVLIDLGDEQANVRPDLPGANSPHAIVNHCLGVVDYWVGHLVAGRPVERDRPAEFTASGPVKVLVERVAAAKEQLRADLAEPTAPLRIEPPTDYLATKPDLTQGAALLHVFEELAQHHGQLEITRDVLRHPHSTAAEVGDMAESVVFEVWDGYLDQRLGTITVSENRVVAFDPSDHLTLDAFRQDAAVYGAEHAHPDRRGNLLRMGHRPRPVRRSPSDRTSPRPRPAASDRCAPAFPGQSQPAAARAADPGRPPARPSPSCPTA